MLDVLLKPAIAILDRLSYAKKIILLGFISLISLSIVSIALYQHVYQTTEQSRQQMAGVKQILAVHKLIHVTQQKRGLLSGSINNEISDVVYQKKNQQADLLFKALLADLDPLLSAYVQRNHMGSSWENLYSRSDPRFFEDNFSAHTKFIAQLQELMVMMSERYQWTTIAGSKSHYLQEAIINAFPSMTESMGQLRGIVMRINAKGGAHNREEHQLVLYKYEFNRSVAAFTKELNTVIRHSPLLNNDINKTIANLAVAQKDINQFINSDLNNHKFNKPTQEIYTFFTLHLDAVYELLYRSVIPALEQSILTAEKNAKKNLYQVIGASSAIFLLLLYLFLGLYSSVINGFKNILKVLNEYRNGKLDNRININSHDEIFTISQSMNSMAESLARVYVENERVTEIAIQANKDKSQFISSMNHELRTPLNTILGFAQLLDSDNDPPLAESQKESVGYILLGGQHLLTLINEILDLSAIESGKVTCTIDTINLSDVINEILPLAQNLASQTNVDIRVLSDLDTYIQADSIKLKQILLNLIGNAIKYNRDGGSISIDWSKTENNMIRTSVIDTGIGISEDNQEKVFYAFNRLGQESTDIPGSGVGLVVTKRLIEIMKGQIGFNSTLGEGTTFWFELPMAEVKAMQQTEVVNSTESRAEISPAIFHPG
ncbi:MAG: ATP-binding protein [Gammaproteobacteria bacterium]|nr:ATP-binding protein [Gammaproteobacteria bacterium]